MKVYDGGSSHLPIKVNPAGVIPAIFASSMLLLPTTISTFSGEHDQPGSVLACCQPWLRPAAAPAVPGGDDRVLRLLLHAQRQLQGRRRGREPEEPECAPSPASVPARRPRSIWNTWSTASWSSARPIWRRSALLPEILISRVGIPFYFGGTSVLIVVSVDDGHDPAGPVASSGAPVRRADREVAAARPQAHQGPPRPRARR